MSKGISELEYWGVHYFHELYMELYKVDMNSEIMKQYLIDRWGVDIVEAYWELYMQKVISTAYRMNEFDI